MFITTLCCIYIPCLIYLIIIKELKKLNETVCEWNFFKVRTDVIAKDNLNEIFTTCINNVSYQSKMKVRKWSFSTISSLHLFFLSSLLNMWKYFACGWCWREWNFSKRKTRKYHQEYQWQNKF